MHLQYLKPRPNFGIFVSITFYIFYYYLNFFVIFQNIEMKFPKKSGLKSSIINIMCSEYSLRSNGYDSVPLEKLNMVN